MIITNKKTNRNCPELVLGEFALLNENISVFDKTILVKLYNCLKFAEEKHLGQYYVWQNHEKFPYTFHISNVARNALLFHNDYVLAIIAFWHDLIEDGRCSEKELLKKILDLGLIDFKELIISALYNLNRKNFVSATDYYNAVCSNKYSLVIKAADLLANLDACLIRFNEMAEDGTIKWTYNYLFEIQNILFGEPEFTKSEKYSLIKDRLSQKILQVKKCFSQRQRDEFLKFCSEVRL